MRRPFAAAAALTIAALACLSACRHAEIRPVAVEFGTAAPPATLFDCTLTPFPLDPRFAKAAAPYVAVKGVPGPSGVLAFDREFQLGRIGHGWPTWPHGYTGDIYWSGGATSATLTLPPGTRAFVLYAEPNAFAVGPRVEIVNAAGVSGRPSSHAPGAAVDTDGNAGAKGYGFFAPAGSPELSCVRINADTDFAVGEFFIGSSSRSPAGLTGSPARTAP